MFPMDSDLEHLAAKLTIMDLNQMNVSSGLASFGFKYSHCNRPNEKSH